MASSYQAQLEIPLHQQMEAHELIAHLAQSELLTHTNERTAYYLKLAELKLNAFPESIECSATRNITKQ